MIGKCRRGVARLAAGVIAAGVLTGVPLQAEGRVMLQYFEGRWETIERRMPDIFMAGYGAMWLPPPSRADSGNQSAGYDVFDRFDLGQEGNPTLYGTESGLRRLVQEANQAGLLVYFDTIYNHNGFSDGTRGDLPGENCALRWAIDEGGYPGFVMSGRDIGLPFDLEFREICGSTIDCNVDPLNCRISGLIDINHDTNYQWIRHPVEPGHPDNIPHQEFRVDPNNRRFYPDTSLPQHEGFHPFNPDNPMAGDPVTENVNQMLQRWTQWMLEDIGADGFRLDAVKHTPAGWFTNIYDVVAHQRAYDFWGRRTTPFSFGELISGSLDELAPYHRMDGFGNRTVLDFPLKFAMNDNIANPSGNFSTILGTTADALGDGNTQNGSAGVLFVQSHDTGAIGDPPPLQNVAYAHILSRKGYPVVYYNPQEFLPTLGNRDFPNPISRGDALGQFGEIITTLVGINNDLVNRRSGNDYRSLWADADYIAYELNNTLVVGMTDRDDQGSTGLGYEERTVSNFGFRGVTLVELTGNAADPFVDPNGDIPETITIPSEGSIVLRVPTNENANGEKHGRPYVMYGLQQPVGVAFDNAAGDVGLRVIDPAFTLGPDGEDVPFAQRRNTPVDVVTGDSVTIELQLDQSFGAIEDNALIKWNYGINIDGDDSGDFGVAFGVDDPLVGGFENFAVRSPTSDGGTGTYSITVDLDNPDIPEGLNYLTAIAFLERVDGLPPVFTTFRKVIYVDRRAPDVEVVFPQTQTGVGDIGPGSYEFVIENPDGTGNSMHVFWNLDAETDPIGDGLLGDDNRATQTDRNRWRFTVADIAARDFQELTVVLFEETGNSTVERFPIGAGVPIETDSFVIH